MATSAVTLQYTSEPGLTATLTAVSTGNTYTVDLSGDPVVLLFVNGATAGTATIAGEAEQSEHEAVSETVTLGASKNVLVGPLDPGKWGQSVGVSVTQSGNLAALALPLSGRAA